MKIIISRLILIVTAFVLSQTSYAALIKSDFTNGTEGWYLPGDATTSYAKWASSGYIYGDDRAKGGIWYFGAPKKFLGDLSGAFGNSFDFSTTWKSSGRTLSASNLLYIWGNGQSITYGPTRPRENSWTDYSLTLDDSVNWNFSGGGYATNKDILNILSNVSAIWIRGEWGYGSDRGYLDNISLQVDNNTNSVSEPSGMAFFAATCIFGLAICRKKRA